jgi:DMSO/TMAO reductase YedYZ molybdopterin-dependent catalytic subunit
MTPKLEALVRQLDALDGRAPLNELTSLLRRFDLRCEDVAEYVTFSDQDYQRNLVRAGRGYHLWVLCWKNGQRSPIHDHAGSSCAVRVLRGRPTVTDFAFAPNGHVKAVASHDLGPGSVVGSQDNDLHQVSNLQAGDADAVTLHVYSPPLVRMGTYSLTDRRRGEEVWVEQRKVVTASPENSETPLESVHGWVTPNRLFFVRNHFEAPPALDPSSWRLTVGGRVRRPAEWTWAELAALPQRSVFATVECAGNGRSFLRERQPGVQWGAGAIGHAEWTGVPLHLVLEQAGIEPEAVEVLFEGADRGSESDHPEPMNFARGLPLAKALDRDTLLVLRMNGELLAPGHGAPARLFVPGWYGVASVKWLRRIEVLDRPFRGYYQTTKYTVKRRADGRTETVVVGPMAVKSEIIRPQAGAVLSPGTNRLFGVAWAGEEAVARVEVSTDGGRSWEHAELLGSSNPYCWALWEYLWEVAEPGEYEILARATSTGGRTQPTEHDPLFGGYMIHHSRPLVVRVGAGQRVQARPAVLPALLYDMNAFAEENMRRPLDVEMEFAAGGGI